MSRFIRNQFRTWLDAISGMTAPVGISTTPQNVTGAHIQLTREGYDDFQTLDDNGDAMIAEDFRVVSIAGTAAEADANAELIVAALASIDGQTLTDRIVEACDMGDIQDGVVRDPAGDETGDHFTQFTVRLLHRPVS